MLHYKIGPRCGLLSINPNPLYKHSSNTHNAYEVAEDQVRDLQPAQSDDVNKSMDDSDIIA